MAVRSDEITFTGAEGQTLAARYDQPDGRPRGVALFAHCFTCSKDSHAAARVSQSLAAEGFAVLRFDFTGLGGSGGDFANTDFSSNVDDLVAAAQYLREGPGAPDILVGHSFGGAAVLAAAARVPEAKCIATIGAPADPAHVAHLFDRDAITAKGAADVSIGGRTFTLTKGFLDDIAAQNLATHVAELRRALLVFHAPRDEIVGIENAGEIFGAARHPKSFVSLDTANHLLTDRADARYVGAVLASWAARYLDTADDAASELDDCDTGEVCVAETGTGRFAQHVNAGGHFPGSNRRGIKSQ